MSSPDPGRLLRARLYERRRDDGDTHERAVAFVERHFARTGFSATAEIGQEAEDARHESAIDERMGEGGRLRGGVSTTLQGLSLGTSDELGAAVRSIPAVIPGGESYGEAFSRNVDMARGGIDDAREAFPGQSLTTEIAGAAAPFLLTGGVSAPASGAAGAASVGRLAGAGRTMARVAQTPVRGGALLGGAYAAGTAEGNPIERLDDAALGAGTGAAAGGLLVGASRLAAPVASRAVDLVRPQLSRLAESQPALGIQSVRDRAVESLANAMSRAGLTSDALAAAARDARPGETIMDVAARTGVDRGALQRMGIGAVAGGTAGALADPGDSPVAATAATIAGAAMGRRLPGNAVSRLARAAHSVPSEGSDRLGRFLNERAAGAGGRLRGSIERRTGQALEDVTATADELVARRAENAAPLYDEAFRAGDTPRTVDASVVEEVAGIPQFRSAYERGRSIARLEGVDLPELPDAASRTRSDMRAAGTPGDALPAPTTEIPVEAIDYMKRGVDAMIETGLRGGSLSRREASLLRTRLDEVLGRVDEAVPEYGAARSQFFGDSRAMEALALARGEIPGEAGFLQADPRVLRRTIAGMSETERDLYQRGALDALRHEIEKTSPTYDLAARITRRESPEMLERLRILFEAEPAENLIPSTAAEQFAGFMDDMGRERGMAETRQFVTGGSPTARIQAEQGDLAAGALPRLTEMVRPGNLAMRALDNSMAGRLRGLTEATVDELEPFLTTPLDQGGSDLILQAIEAMRRREAQAIPPVAGRLLGRAAAFGTGAYASGARDREP